MKCLETRTRKGMKWRRYRTDDGRTVTTYEVPTTVLSTVTSASRLTQALETFARGEQKRARAARMLALVREGVKPAAIAHELGVTEQAVRLARKRLNSESKR